MNHYSIHPNAAFQGYYSKFRLPSGASIALIISAVPSIDPHSPSYKGKGKSNESTSHERPAGRPYMISFNYVTSDSTRWWQRDYWPKQLDMQSSPHGFVVKFEQGEFTWTKTGESDQVQWSIHTDELDFDASTSGEATGWDPRTPRSTPAGFLANLPLPIQWHVHSVDSPCEFSLAIRSTDTELKELPLADQAGTARVHLENNWALSFPQSYLWIQARDHQRNKGIVMAGGSLFENVQAYLVGYQGDTIPSNHGQPSQRFISFLPPTSTSIFSLSLGLSSSIDFPSGTASIDIKGWFTRLRVTAESDHDTFHALCAPLSTGHAPGYSVQSFAARIKVVVEERRWPWSSWVTVEEEVFENGSLEFGGGFYKSTD